MKIKSRHHLRSDEEDKIKSHLEDSLGVEMGDYNLEEVELEEDFDILLGNGDPIIMRFGDEYFVTVQGALELGPEKRLVTVDAGAVEFVTNGADVMRPGIVEADRSIQEDDLVIIVEENHEKALAIGRALTSGNDMTGDSGKVIENLHHVGDEVWEFEP